MARASNDGEPDRTRPDRARSDQTRPVKHLEPGTIVSHYRIVGKIGAGGMGVVYRAEDVKLGRQVALKFLPTEFTSDPEARARFGQEARAASALDHSNICTIHEIDETAAGEIFISMACYDGETLAQQIERGPLAVEHALAIAIQVCEGLARAHAKGIVHRDIKPGNLMITTDGAVKIMDFGIAKLADQPGMTAAGSILGTVRYMSPEQASGEPMDARADIWSLGAVLYEILAGRPPFGGEHPQAVIHAVLNSDHAPVGSLRRDLPAGLEAVVAKAMARRPELRYQSAADLSADLSRIREALLKAEAERAGRAADARPSIAVLPFANLSPDPEQEFFCDGIAEEMINTLTHVEGLRVVARTSAFAFKGKPEDIREIGRKLNVENVLEGSVRKAGDKLRVTAQLIKVSDGYHLWSERFDRRMDDVFALQDEISLAVVERLRVSLITGEKVTLTKHHTEDVHAYSLYLQGRYFWNKRTGEGLKKAVEFFTRAIEQDPEYALAHSGLADAYNVLGSYGLFDATESHRRSKAAALRALELDPNLAEAHASLGGIISNFENDPKRVDAEYRRAIELNPGYATARHWYSMRLMAAGDLNRAIEEVARALELDPLSWIIKRHAADLRAAVYDWRGAEALFRESIEIDPSNENVRSWYAYLLLEIGREQDGMAEMDRALALDPANPLTRRIQALLLFYTRRYDDALEVLTQLAAQLPSHQFTRILLGSVYLMIERHQESLAAFEEAKHLAVAKDDYYFLAEGMRGCALAAMGREADARQIIKDLLSEGPGVFVPPTTIAMVCAALGDVDETFAHLERGLGTPDRWLRDIRLSPVLDAYRADPRYKALLKRMNLPE